MRREAAELLGRRLLSGLPGAQLTFGTASGTVRYNRAEGLAVATGARYSPAEQVTLGVHGGFAFGRNRPFAEVEAWRGTLPDRVGIGAYYDQPVDLGGFPVISGAMNSLTALLAGYDYSDAYFTRGAELRMDRALGRGWNGAFRLRVEEQRSANRVTDFSLLGGSDHFRPVAPIVEGTFYGGSVALRRPVAVEVARGLSLGVGVDGGQLRRTARTTASRGRGWTWAGCGAAGPARSWRWTRSAGGVLGDMPPQAAFLLGGRGTVPGYEFRSYRGDAFGLARATYAADLVPSFVRGRVFAAGGWTGDSDPPSPLGLSELGQRRGGMVSVGAGVGLFFDILRIDVARGLTDGGVWEVIIEANPSFWDFL